MNIYIDFDGTLYNSDLLLSKYISFLNEYTISTEEVNNCINQLFLNEKFNIFKLHKYIVKKYSKVPRDIPKSVYDSNCVYIDVKNTLEQLSKRFNLILLTYGDIEYQKFKIENSNLRCYFKDIIITKKRKYKLNIDYKNSIFIDNNPNEINGYISSGANKIIRIRRKDDKYSTIDDLNKIASFSMFNHKLIKKCEEMRSEIYE